MGVFPSIVTFLVIWWTVLFIVLPLGMGRGGAAGEAATDIVPGADPGAPAMVDMPRKFALTTAIAAGLWAVVFLLALSGVIDLEEMSFAALARGGS